MAVIDPQPTLDSLIGKAKLAEWLVAAKSLVVLGLID